MNQEQSTIYTPFGEITFTGNTSEYALNHLSEICFAAYRYFKDNGLFTLAEDAYNYGSELYDLVTEKFEGGENEQ